jgi:hypothetical protein
VSKQQFQANHIAPSTEGKQRAESVSIPVMHGLFDSLYIILTGANRLFMLQATIVEEMVSDTDFTKPPLAKVIVDHSATSAHLVLECLGKSSV